MTENEKSSDTLPGLREALAYLTRLNNQAIDEDDAPRVRDLTPMITRLQRDIRTEEERQKLLITFEEAREVLGEVVNAMIALVWQETPEHAPAICMKLPEYMGIMTDES